MKNRTFVDHNGRTNYEVGGIIPAHILSQLTTAIIRDVEHTEVFYYSDGIQIYRKRGEAQDSRIVGWGLACQNHFYVVDDGGKILFSSGRFSIADRSDGDCEFFSELREFINNGWQGPESTEVLLNDDEDFII